MNDNTKLCAILGGILLVALVVFLYSARSKRYESYSNIGDVDNTGSFALGDSFGHGAGMHGAGNYELVDAAEEHAPTPHFADLVDAGQEQSPIVPQPPAPPPANLMRHSAKRLVDDQGSDLLPRVSRHVTPYNVDVADPVTHAYMVNPPRVQLKDPLKLRADPYRGDIPIKYYPNVSLIGNSRYGRDSLRLDGFFSDQFKFLYNKYTGKGYKNLPMSVVNEETIMDA